ncbi:MAG: response regulator [Myxococcales bacterium]|nr:response regulator [Myxococcales bacterium]
MTTSNSAEAAYHILLVEDDAVDVKTVQRAFRENNISNSLSVATNGEEALEMLKDGRVNPQRLLILLDINMPRMNGIEFLRHIRGDESLRHLSVVVLTTSNDDRDRIEAYRLNVAGYILKPVTFNRFVKAMAALNKYWTLVELP